MSHTIQVETFWKNNNSKFINDQLQSIDNFLKQLYVDTKNINREIIQSLGVDHRTMESKYIKLYKLIQEIHYTRRNAERSKLNPHISIKLIDNSTIYYYFFPIMEHRHIKFIGEIANQLRNSSFLYLRDNSDKTIEDIFENIISNNYVEQIYSPDVNIARGKKLKPKKQRTRTKHKPKKQRTRRKPKPKKQRTRTKPKLKK